MDVRLRHRLRVACAAEGLTGAAFIEAMLDLWERTKLNQRRLQAHPLSSAGQPGHPVDPTDLRKVRAALPVTCFGEPRTEKHAEMLERQREAALAVQQFEAENAPSYLA